jgi:hypothetical protein
MAELTNPRWESFARYISLGYSYAKAYKAAGFGAGSAAGNASVLVRRPEVMARVQELLDAKIEMETGTSAADIDRFDRQRSLVRAGEKIDPVWIVDQLMENVKIARENGQIAAANKALEMLGKEVGLFQEKKKGADDVPEMGSPTPNAIPVSQVNKLLDALGFSGKVDLATMQPIAPEKALALSSSGGDDT